ncbi:MAG: ATP-binding cassette domain-containing protein [Acidimicrobiaceae bacterium]|nr:ATP-binding cassette domain-containing protein [Acidimicrobiaceae bacterium]MYD06260.1 ATP-binding cassette domain-containing protein [Acidimicrobiaceae bacterium]MYI59351.1 ATP-binding cassette domain-containing protein [Acidimicrobiaceae bacterium]
MTSASVSASRQPAVRCRGLSRVYGERVVLSDLDLDVAEGRHVAVMGPSGSGKTTLLHILAGIAEPSSGQVVVAGLDVVAASAQKRAQHRQRKVAMVFQFGELLFELTVGENVRSAVANKERGSP